MELHEADMESNEGLIAHRKTEKPKHTMSRINSFFVLETFEEIEEKATELIPKNRFSGLHKGQTRTQGHILKGFWINGGFAVFLTLDNAKYIYIEVYDFDGEIKPVCERVFLCNSNFYDIDKIKLNSTRDIIALILCNK